VLLLRKRDAGHVGAGIVGEIQSQPAPAAADIKHARARIDPEFGCEMALFRKLGVVERLIGGFEIAAAILPVGVEEQ
jgi:hypothetical protein